jgi:hemolysin activation/secretion protein
MIPKKLLKNEMKRPVKIILLVAALMGGSGTASVSFAQQPPAAVPAAPRFEITRYEISGNTLVSQQELERRVAPYTGSGKDFSDVQRALEAVELAYRDLGYGIVQVLLPEQDITKGVVQLRVLEPRVGRVIIEGNKFFDEANIRNSLPSVKEGETPSSRRIARNLQPLNEHPVKQTNVVIRSGASEDQVDIAVKITDDKPQRVFVTLDNTGTSETGYLRTGLGFQHSNLFNRDHTLTAQYITSPGQIHDVTIAGVGYRVPFYGWNSTLDLIAGYSSVDSGTVQGLFNVSGSGTIAAVRWNYFLPKWGELDQKVSFGLDYRALQSNVDLVGVPLGVPDITVHPASLTYTAVRRFSNAELNFYGSVSTNLPYGQDGDAQAFERSRTGATSNYVIWRYGLNYTRALPADWQLRFAFNGQYTDDMLVSAEQFGIGGPDSVRGFALREMSNDRGYQGQAEVYTPDFSRRLGMTDDYRLRFLGFFDFGHVSRVGALPGELESDSMTSAGAGVRLNWRKSISVRVDLARILHSTANRATNSQRLHGALAIVF